MDLKSHKDLPLLIIGMLLFSLVFYGCSVEQEIPKTMEKKDVKWISLPTPIPDGDNSLEELLQRRRSVREFSNIKLDLKEIGQLLWAAQGITDTHGYRTAPSAGALYPLELYVVSSEGVFHYEPGDHGLFHLRQDDLRSELCKAALDQEAICDAPATFIISAVYERIEKKYGSARSPRYVHLEAGHAAQNLLLQAVSLGLGATPIGAFDDSRVQSVLGLPDDHKPLYLIPVGRKK